jgi:serine/threonine protein kinase
MLEHTNYTIKHEIGSGGMATVFLAYDKQFKSDVAIKILNKEFVHNNHIRQRFLDEARKIYKMNHPNIIRVTQIIEQEQDVGIVMEYIEGETLKDFIDRQGKLSNLQIKHFLLQMIEALSYVHQQNIVHRDIKPSNFMIDKKGVIKLLDFGIAKNNNQEKLEYTQTSASYQMGTPMYMSPEQINEAKNVTAQSDIYSLGVVLWCMVEGKRPYEGNSLSTFQLLSKIVNESLEKTSSVFQPIIDKCTYKNTEQRYSDVNSIKTELLTLDIENQNLEFNNQGQLSNSRSKSTEQEKTTIVQFKDNGNPTTNKLKYIISGAAVLLIAISLFIYLKKGKDQTEKTTESPAFINQESVFVDTAANIKEPIDDSKNVSIVKKKTVPDFIKKHPEKQESEKKEKIKETNSIANKKNENQKEAERKIESQNKDAEQASSSPNDETIPENKEVKKEGKLKKGFNKFKNDIKKIFKKKD